MPLEPSGAFVDIDKVPLSSLPAVVQEPFTHHAAIGVVIGISAAVIAYLGLMGCIWLAHRWRYLKLTKERPTNAREIQSGLHTEPERRVDNTYIQQASITIWASERVITRDVVRYINHLSEVIKEHPFPASNIDGGLKEEFNGDVQYALTLRPCIDMDNDTASFFSNMKPSAEFLLPHSSPGRYFILKSQWAGRSAPQAIAMSIWAAGMRIAEGETRGTEDRYTFLVEPAPYRK